MHLTCWIPERCETELCWVGKFILVERLGLNVTWRVSDRREIRLEADGRHLDIRNDFLARAVSAWRAPETLPSMPLREWDLATSILKPMLTSVRLPVLFGAPGFLSRPDGSARLDLDVFGSAFFMLSRYPEAIRAERDVHGRFPAAASIAYQAGFLGRPIVDEYVEVLWEALQHVWPGLQRALKRPRIRVSCDVDSGFALHGSALANLRTCAGALLLNESWAPVGRQLHASWRAWRGDHSLDTHRRAIEWMMDENEKLGRAIAFYFIPECTDPVFDGQTCLNDPRMRELLRHVHRRGHEIGIHPGYRTHRSPDRFASSVKTIRRVLEDEGIPQDRLGGRQHFLRWETPTTACLWEMHGFAYDSTLTYAERPGFRCGTCHEFPMFDVQARRPMRLRERPLVVMECSVIAKRYMGLGRSDKALAIMQGLREVCHRFRGDFTLLWHNSHLEDPRDREMYQQLIR